jgi:hypothetical protein
MIGLWHRLNSAGYRAPKGEGLFACEGEEKEEGNCGVRRTGKKLEFSLICSIFA